MADSKLTAIYTASPVTVDPGNLAYAVVDTGTTPDEGAFKYSQLMFNRYRLVPSVATNNLTLALKHEDGTDPSTDRPLYFKIGDSLRIVNAALSVTLAAGTDWFACGSTLAAKEVDFFAYIIWNTTGTDAVNIGFGRVPYFDVYSQASGTSTVSTYLATSGTVTSTDDMVVIGRFPATLSAGAGYTWTVPAFTSLNLKSRPIYETRRLSFTSTLTGFSGTPTQTCSYKVRYDTMVLYLSISGTSNATNFTASIPLAPVTGTNDMQRLVDNGAAVAGLFTLAGASVVFYSSVAAGTWTNSGTKGVEGVTKVVQIL